MAFVAEVIPAEDQKQFEDKTLWYRPGRRWPLESNERVTWCIDRERNIFVRGVGGSCRAGDSLLRVLCIQGIQVQYRVKETSSCIIPNNYEAGFLVEWYIFDIEIPSELNNQQAEIRQLIEDTCIALFKFRNRSNLDKIEVLFSEPPTKLMIG